MGCFDVACGISSMSIKHGDDALLLFLIPYTEYPDGLCYGDKKGKVEIETGVQQVFNEGPQGLYMPFCLPIRGKYNDYGSLEEIVEDETFKGLEKFFGTTFEKIINAIHRGRYGSLHDEEMLAIFGNGLPVDRYSNGAVTKEWLIKGGFTEKDGKFYHPDVTNILKYGEDGKVVKTDEQKAYVEFKVPFKGSGEKKVMPHICYWENEKWNEIWQREQKDFCETFMEKTKPMGWFATEEGVALGIKRELLGKARLLRAMSGMFIDGKFYDNFTSEVKTNKYFREGNSIRTCYMNKYLMDKIGFKFERIVIDETKKEPTGAEDEAYKDLERLYSHPKAPGFLFGVRERHSMATDMYKVKDNGELEEVKTYNGKRSYHPFSPEGLAKMFEGETGNKLDLSGLDGLTTFDISLMRIQDFIKGRENNRIKAKEIEKQLEKFKDRELTKEEEKERSKMLSAIFKLEDRMDRREKIKEGLGSFHFPFAFDFYESAFKKPSKKFRATCIQYRNMMASLWGINRPLMPSAHFGQHGELMDQLAFVSIVKDAIKEKMLDGYGKEFTDKDEMQSALEMLYGEVKETPGFDEDKNVQVEFHDKDQLVAVWRSEDEYGYLITEKGR